MLGGGKRRLIKNHNYTTYANYYFISANTTYRVAANFYLIIILLKLLRLQRISGILQFVHLRSKTHPSSFLL